MNSFPLNFPSLWLVDLTLLKKRALCLKLLQYLKIPFILDVASNLRGQGEILQELKKLLPAFQKRQAAEIVKQSN